MSLPPALPLDNSRAITIVVVSVLLSFLATLVVVGRFISRHIRRVGYGADDWLTVAALLALYAHMTLIIVSTVNGGIGRHTNELTADHFTLIFKILAAAQFTFGMSLGLVKISLCCLLIRVFTSRTFRVAALTVSAYCVAWTLMTVFLGAALCRPFSENWSLSRTGVCGHQNPTYVTVAALDIVGDMAIIILPMPMIWKLQISTPSKIGLSCLFAFGFLDVIAAILRITYLTNLTLSLDADFTYHAYGTWLWSIIEPSLAVIVACGAVMNPLFEAVFPCFRGRFGIAHESRNAKSFSRTFSPTRTLRSPGRGSDSEIPLHRCNDTAKSKYSRTSTRAEGGVMSPIGSRFDKVDSIWVQRDITVQVSNTEELEAGSVAKETHLP